MGHRGTAAPMDNSCQAVWFGSLWRVELFVFLVLIIALHGNSTAVFTAASTTAHNVSCLQALHARDLSPVWIQYGEPRSASTLQYFILGVFARLICGSQHTRAAFLVRSRIPALRKVVVPGNHITILKCHDTEAWGWVQKATGASQIDVFLSRRHEKGLDTTLKLMSDYSGFRVKYVQLRKAVEAQGAQAVFNEHATRLGFDATSDRIARAREWVKLWSIQRICCGHQLSVSWRKALYALGNNTLDAMPAKTHICQQYNFTAVEGAMNVKAIEAFGPDAEDLKVSAGLCECSIRATAKYKLEFNDPRYEHYCRMSVY